jgi:hypothetical protein
MRTVILDEMARAALDEANGYFSRVYDAQAGLEWRLCRRPMDGVARKRGYYTCKQLGIKSMRIPTITALYIFDDEAVTIKRLVFRAAR